MKITEHFNLENFACSDIARNYHIKNIIPHCYFPNIKALCINILEPLRMFAQEPIIILSGYRCKSLNIAIGGITGSQHLTAEAADIKIHNIATGRVWFNWLRHNCEFDQLIWEHDKSGHYWIHISFKRIDRNRQTYIPNLLNK